ncbi:hypothetical protein EV175_001303 [Coemansia sp. RSA 1933]|nr:hypothetical protein EV175_001303 [Coemansia sp. RSA 1933]
MNNSNGTHGHTNTTARISSALKNTDLFGGDAHTAFGNGYGSDEDVAGVESDDPTNTAMCLDENDERELHGVTPGTPMALQKLGQLTVKSITRQKDAQTPGRTRVGLVGSSGSRDTGSADAPLRYVNVGSPSKKGKQSNGMDLMSSAIPRLTPKKNANQGIKGQQGSVDDDSVPKAISRIRASQRAGAILSRIRMGSVESKISKKAPLALVLAEKSNVAFENAHVHNQALARTALDKPKPDKNEISPFMLSKPRILFPAMEKDDDSEASIPDGRHDSIEERCKTPENRRPMPTNTSGTPYNQLRTLSEKLDRSQTGIWTGDSDARDISSIPFPPTDPFAATPKQRKRPLEATSTPMTGHRQRLDTLRKFFHESSGIQQPDEPHIDVESMTPVRTKQHDGALLESSGGSSNALISPSPVRKILPKTINGAYQNASSPMDGCGNSVSSLLVSLAGENQDQDSSKPIPFVLNRDMNTYQHQKENTEQGTSSGQNDFMDFSMQLNSSIAALNVGLREQLERGEGASGSAQNGVDTAVDAMDKVTAQLSQSLVSLVPDTGVGRNSSRKQAATERELETQVEMLRKTMEDTKNIVFAIQSELRKRDWQEQEQPKQQGLEGLSPSSSSSEDSKLDSILGLLGALDMRLHMLEGRQRLEQNSSLSPQRSNIGSTKVYAGNRQQSPAQDRGHHCQNRQQDIVSRIGQLAANCINQYPLMIIGALFIILLSELLIIGGFGLDMQSMRGFGQYALEEVKRHMPQPPQPPS